MKAAVRTIYGIPGDLTVKEIDIPTPGDDDILIRVHASTVNRSDCHVLSGKPFAMKFFTGMMKPKHSIIGSDFTGEIAAVGRNVTSFKKDDKIMGFGGGLGCGAHAQYFILSETKARKVMVPMAKNLSYQEAAACLEGAFYAASVLLGMKINKEQKTLVYGASGAIGSSYVQYLKNMGIYVTAVCDTRNIELMKSLGADKVVDYTTTDFLKDEERYDIIFDAVGKSSFAKCKKLLKEKGLYTSSGGAINMLLIFTTPIFGGKKVIFPRPKKIIEGLNYIKGLIEAGKFKPIIDRVYPLEQITDAFVYVASGKKSGNVVIDME